MVRWSGGTWFVGGLLFAALACSGKSSTSGRPGAQAGAGGGGSGDGGTGPGGTGTGGSVSGSAGSSGKGGDAGSMNCTPGETQVCLGPGRCQGAQECSHDGTAWEACDCGTGGSGGTGGTGDGGATTIPDPFAMCPAPPLANPSTCSFEASCELLDCGSPVSLQGEDGCLRTTCVSSDDCAAGERCLPAPVAGVIRDCWPSGCDGCEEIDGKCSCSCFDNCVERAVCVPESDHPVDADCPIAGLTCAGLREAHRNVEQYLADDGTPYAGDALQALEDCRQTLLDGEQAPCDFCEGWEAIEGRCGATHCPASESAAVSAWSGPCDDGMVVGISRGCNLNVVFYADRTNYIASWTYDASDHLVGYYEAYEGGDSGCDRSTRRGGTQIECLPDTGPFCDPTLRQLFSLDQQVSCPSFETCVLCGSDDYPSCDLMGAGGQGS